MKDFLRSMGLVRDDASMVKEFLQKRDTSFT